MTVAHSIAETVTLTVQSVYLSTGVSLEYVEQGRPHGIPLILIHGITDSWRSFEQVLRHLPPTIRAFALSQRGHGESSRPDTGYGCGDMSEDLRAFMDALRLPTAVVVGHSMSATVAQRFAVDHQDRLAGLVLTGAFSTHRQTAAMREFVNTDIARLKDPVDPAFVRAFQVSTLARAVDPGLLETAVRESLKVPARVWRAAFEAHVAAPDLSRALRSVTAPTLLIWGDRDEYAVREDQDALLAAMPSARLVTVEGGGHAPHWEDPAWFARQLTAFARATRERPADGR